MKDRKDNVIHLLEYLPGVGSGGLWQKWFSVTGDNTGERDRLGELEWLKRSKNSQPGSHGVSEGYTLPQMLFLIQSNGGRKEGPTVKFNRISRKWKTRRNGG